MSPNPVFESEINTNIKQIEPHIKILMAMIKTCALCNMFDHCLTRMVEAAGITADMLVDTVYNRIMECNTFDNEGMCWKIDIKDKTMGGKIR